MNGKKCPSCGACQECGHNPNAPYYPYRWWYQPPTIQPQPYTQPLPYWRAKCDSNTTNPPSGGQTWNISSNISAQGLIQ